MTMSGKHTSAADVPRFPSSENWSDEDGEWEVLQEQASIHRLENRLEEAGKLWGEALLLARKAFTTQDPRLAASIANYAYFAARNGDKKAAAEMFDEALQIWDASGPWLDALKVERKAKSSLFHLRLEAKNRGTFEANQRKRLGKFAAEGRAAIAALAAGKPADTRGQSRWWPEKTPQPSDARKLLAAVLLTVRIDEIGTA